MTRDEVLKIILYSLKENDLVIFTTGMISREAFTIGDRPRNFYMVGSMGLVTPVALGIALNKPKRKVVAVDGDGSLLLNLGILPMVAVGKPANFLHLVLDNESYESTGGQPSISNKVDLAKLARAAGYRNVRKVTTFRTTQKAIKTLPGKRGPNFLLIKVEKSRIEGASRTSLLAEEMKKRVVT